MLLWRKTEESSTLDRGLISYTSKPGWWRLVLYIPLIKQFIYLRRRRDGHYPFLNRWVLRSWNNWIGTENVRFAVEDGDRRAPK